MFDLGLGIGEILVLSLIALIVIGPQDLPQVFYKTGRFIGQIRQMVHEFTYNMNHLAQEQEIEQLKHKLEQQNLKNNKTPDAASGITPSVHTDLTKNYD